ncbi:hypothetical protein POSPLADRAFT_1181499 [Postia placenta MAD-698-R-SB12]|uniref:Endoplasmic reticulum-based factor for assembly of V-ATPase n=1 Tax=Postia placenta MAD-698-R-SB12 TaxID=670580 RepID=A0A1X6N194_9APHY|nr:hypothetical protein POSPLADRAFT_1181499 [Postia placenta MAD-698-R-SB12]OSX62387.1 hypothetical protein POSPLADRAFT_1181499 [Postia placenta MAD-698-R-SB12]
MSSESELTVSLEPHLVDVLKPLPHLLPASISSRLSPFLSDDSLPASTIPYALLSAISSWSRSAEGTRALQEHSTSLKPSDYSMIALLAGTRTSPDKKFPHIPVRSPLEDAQREVSDRRAVVAIVNALLSIGGSGAATWWAAGRLAWKDEWKVLFALLVATVVAISEAILYMIWDARRSGRPLIVRTKPPVQPAKKTDGDTPVAEEGGLEVKAVASTGTSTATPTLEDRIQPHQPHIRERGLAVKLDVEE